MAKTSILYNGPTIQKFTDVNFSFALSPNGTWTAGDTYTVNGVVYTATNTVVGGATMLATGRGSPLAPTGTLTRVTGSGSASLNYIGFSSSSLSGTYSTPVGVKWLRVRMIGGGGGGGASNNSGPGGTGGATLFGSSLLIANGGSGASYQRSSGGTAGVNLPATGTFLTGGSGYPGDYPGTIPAGAQIAGGAGAASPFGGGGASHNNSNPAEAAMPNTGAGGGGAPSLTANHYTGAGGGAGGYVEAIIKNPSASYTYTVGFGGGYGSGSGISGGAGGSGYIEVTEYYS